MNDTTTYTQVIDEKTGEIKYVPNVPPTPPPAQGGGTEADPPTDEEREVEKEGFGNSIDFDTDEHLTEELQNLLANSKRLRYNRRLQSGKLDGRRLSSYRTSDRLFKKKAIKDRNYQFTFLMDTSGSMIHDTDGKTKIQMACEAVAKTVKSLEAIKMRSSVFSMNNACELVKDFETTIDDVKFKKDIVRTMGTSFTNNDGENISRWGGTFEWCAYEQTVAYLTKHSKPGITNVVIILSDGAPGGSGDECLVVIDGEERLVEAHGENDSNSTLAKFWERQAPTLAFGIGINSKASQVPVNKQISDITTLPSVLSNLLTELML